MLSAAVSTVTRAEVRASSSPRRRNGRKGRNLSKPVAPIIPNQNGSNQPKEASTGSDMMNNSNGDDKSEENRNAKSAFRT